MIKRLVAFKENLLISAFYEHVGRFFRSAPVIRFPARTLAISFDIADFFAMSDDSHTKELCQ
jgi:hypothetical protein